MTDPNGPPRSGPLFGPESDPTYEGPVPPSRFDSIEGTAGELGTLEGSAALSQRHREIIRLAFLGRTQVEIAERMSMDKTSIRHILRSPLAQAELARLNSKAETILVNTPLRVALDKDLRDAATESLRLNRSVLSDPSVDMRVRTKTAAHFMDRIIFAEGPDEKEGSYRDILRRLETIDRNVRLSGTGITLFPPGAIRQALGPDEEIKHVDEPRASDGSSARDGADSDLQPRDGGAG